jgi:2-polyprenyl-3-methyl-5-hydroxy-6-metoxy-1,4-benzoquinol methylase
MNDSMETKRTSADTLEISCPVCLNKNISPKHNKKNPSDFGCKNLEKYSMFSCPNCYCEFCYPRDPLIYEYKSTDVYRSFVSKEDFQGRLYHTLNCTAHFKDSPYVYNILSMLNFRGAFLDLGAGSGYMTELARRLGYKVSVVEESRGFREFIKEMVPKVEVYSAIQELEGRKKKFDVVSTMHVIEHVPYPVEVLKNIHSILSPQGILIVVVPNLDRAYYRFGEVGKEIEDLIDWNGIANGYCTSDFPPHHLTRFKEETIKKALMLSGFRNIAIGYSPLNAWDLFYTGLGDDTFRFKDYFNDIVRMKSIALFERRLNEMLSYLNLGNLGWSLIALASDKWGKPYLENLIRQGRQRVMDTYVNNILLQYEELKQGTIKTNEIDKSADEKDMLIFNLENELKQIYNSHGWKALKIYYHLRNLIFPPGSKQREFVKQILKRIRKDKLKKPVRFPAERNQLPSLLPFEINRPRVKLKFTGAMEMAEFQARCAENSYWYHSYYFDNGFIQRGDYDIGQDVADYGFPQSMVGMSVLDIGTGSGWFATYFEQLGADVTVTDARGYCDFDIFGRDCYPSVSSEKVTPDRVLPEEKCVYYSPVSKGFWIMKDILGLKATYVNARIYEICPEMFGGKKFDLVFMGSLLMHLRDPIGALMAAHSVCEHQLIATTYLLEDPFEKGAPLMKMRENAGDGISWWIPNRACLIQWLKAAGFLRFDIERSVKLTVDKPFKDAAGTSSAVNQVQQLVHAYV